MALTQSVTNSSQRVIIKLTKFWKEISNQYNARKVKTFENENMNPDHARDAIWFIPGTDLCGRVPLWNWRKQVRLADSTRPGPSLDKFWFDVIWRVQKYFGCRTIPRWFHCSSLSSSDAMGMKCYPFQSWSESPTQDVWTHSELPCAVLYQYWKIKESEF